MTLHRTHKLFLALSALATLAACGARSNAALAPQTNVSRAALVTSLGLHTQGNQILDANNQVWMARGVNIFDTRGCNACAYNNPDVNEVLRRADAAITDWHANLIRLNLESYASADGRVQWAGVLQDANYLADVKTIVDHISQYQGVTILMSLLIDPTFNAQEIPTQQTADEWTLLAKTFAAYPNVIFGIGNEPHNNSTDDATTMADQNENCWQGMTESVNAIRAVEDGMGTTHHLISVQGTLTWARFTAYYEAHPIQSDNIIYETHIYDLTSVFPTELTNPHQTLPMIIGEFGAWPGNMGMDDCTNLMNLADQLQVPYIGWSFSASCGAAPLLQVTSTDACGIDSALTPTDWGNLLKTHLLTMQPQAPVYTGKQVATPTPTPTATVSSTTVGGGTPSTDGNTPAGVVSNPTTTQTPDPTTTVSTPTPTPTVTAAPTQASSQGAITLSVGGMCMDVLGGVAFDSAGVIISSCSPGQTTQSWTVSGNTVQTQGKCISILNNTPTSGAFLQMQPCDGRASEQFTVQGNTLVAQGSNMCFDVLGGLVYNYMPVVLTACNSAQTQSWSVP